MQNGAGPKKVQNTLDWLTELTPFFEHGSYIAVFLVLVLCGVGLPIPEEITFIAAGIVAHNIGANVWMMIVAGLLGILAGDSLTYLFGRRYGMTLLTRWPFNRFLKQKNLDQARRFIDRHGSHAVFFAGFLAGVRAPTYFLCGSMGLSYVRFLFWDGARAILTCPLSVWLAWRFGESAIGSVKEYSHYMLGALAAVLLLIVLRHLRKRRKQKAAHVQVPASQVSSNADAVASPPLVDKPPVKETLGT